MWSSLSCLVGCTSSTADSSHLTASHLTASDGGGQQAVSQPAMPDNTPEPESDEPAVTDNTAQPESDEPAGGTESVAAGDGQSTTDASWRRPPPQPAAPPPARPPVRRAASGDVVDITFDDLALEMPAGTLFESELLTPRVKELDGENVRLRGFIFAGGVFQSTNIKSFPFVMNTQCKFGPQGLAYCVILVELAEGVTTDFTTYPITVEGKLTVRPFNSGGFTWSVYHMRGTKVY
jgi:hypothetical protein